MKTDAELLYKVLSNNEAAESGSYVGDHEGLVILDGRFDLEYVAAEFLRLRTEQEAAS